MNTINLNIERTKKKIENRGSNYVRIQKIDGSTGKCYWDSVVKTPKKLSDYKDNPVSGNSHYVEFFDSALKKWTSIGGSA